MLTSSGTLTSGSASPAGDSPRRLSAYTMPPNPRADSGKDTTSSDSRRGSLKFTSACAPYARAASEKGSTKINMKRQDSD